MSDDPIDIHPSSLVEIMPSVEVLKQSPLAGLIGTELPTTGVRPTRVILVFEREANYSGDDDVDWDDMHSAPDSRKHFHLPEEEMQVAALGTKSPSVETLIVEGILSFLNHHSIF